jgi:hypothetical protein
MVLVLVLAHNPVLVLVQRQVRGMGHNRVQGSGRAQVRALARHRLQHQPHHNSSSDLVFLRILELVRRSRRALRDGAELTDASVRPNDEGKRKRVPAFTRIRRIGG